MATVVVPLQTGVGPGKLVFDLQDRAASTGRLAEVLIPDEGLRRRFEYYVEGNPEEVSKIGGAQVPENPQGHLDVLLSILNALFHEGFAGFDYIEPDLNTGIPGGDSWR